MKKRLLFVCLICLCIFLCACEASEPKPISWEPVYNTHDICGVQASRMLPEGTTKRDLTEAEIAGIVPETLLVGGKITGTAYFKPDKELYYMALQMQQGEYVASVLLGDISWGGCCMSVTFDGYAKRTCFCDTTEYALFRRDNKCGLLIGHGKVNGIPLLVRMEADDPGEIQPVFENILENFVRYKQDSLNVSWLKP